MSYDIFMPAKNTIKRYAKNTLYHLYNRGINKREIFQTREDFKTFIFFLKKYLSPAPKDQPRRKQKILDKEISLLSFCLMPNHFHLLVKQKTKKGISKLMKDVGTNYAMYFNKKYERSGPLFESRYKGVVVETDEQLLHLSRYIHLNPELAKLTSYDRYPYSSVPYFTKGQQSLWIHPKQILDYFSRSKKGRSYRNFIEGYEKEMFATIKELALEK